MILNRTRKVLKNLLIGTLAVFTALQAPVAHREWLRSRVKNTTVKITNEKGTSGGSGSHVKAPSGKVYILTNAHVCGLSENGTIWVTDDFGSSIPRKIVDVSKYTDLCLIEPLLNLHGYLKIGSDLQEGQSIYAVGHPQLMPTTMTNGEFIGQEEVDVVDHPIVSEDDKCDLPKNRIMDLDSMFGPLKICTIHVNSNLTTTLILPGSSGSPALNSYGNLVGVFFAAGKSNWGLTITLDDVKQFLKAY